MSSKSRYIVLVVLGLSAIEVTGVAFAAGGGAKGSGAGRGGAASFRARNNNGAHFFAPVQKTAIIGTPGAFGNAGWGWGGLGWGYPYPGWGYQLEGVPYFAQYPPVYYGNGENVPVLNSAIRSPWLGIESTQPAAATAVSASLPRPPLRIINPFFVEQKADNGLAPVR